MPNATVYGQSFIDYPPVFAAVTYSYDSSYTSELVPTLEKLFGQYGSPIRLINRNPVLPARVPHLIGTYYTNFLNTSVTGSPNSFIGIWHSSQVNLGGWMLDMHHSYNARSKILSMGNGEHRQIKNLGLQGHYAGTGVNGFSGDGGPALLAMLNYPFDLDVGSDGSVYIADTGNNRIRKVTPNGIINTIAGTGDPSNTGDNGPAVLASLWEPGNISIDADGNLFVAVRAVSGNRISGQVRKISPDGTISLFAGGGSILCSMSDCDGQLAADVALDGGIGGMDIDKDGNLYVSTSSDKIYKVATDGTIRDLVSGNYGFSGDGGPAKLAKLSHPTGISVDDVGNIYILDNENRSIRKIDAAGIISSISSAHILDATIEALNDGSILLPDGNIVDKNGKNISKLSVINNTKVARQAPDGTFFAAMIDFQHTSTHTISRIGSTIYGGEIFIASEDGSQLYYWGYN